jgi:hypothetical protein
MSVHTLHHQLGAHFPIRKRGKKLEVMSLSDKFSRQPHSQPTVWEKGSSVRDKKEN